jgi:hypothetical protein
MKEVYTQHLTAPPKPAKGKAKEEITEDKIKIELDESSASIEKGKDSTNNNNTLLCHHDEGIHAKEAEVMISMHGKNLPLLRIDGPYGTASR